MTDAERDPEREQGLAAEPEPTTEVETGADGEADAKAVAASKGRDEELAEALRGKEQFKRLAQRAQADLANYRRRAQAERDSLRTDAARALLLRFLAIRDELGASLSERAARGVDERWLEGVRGVVRNFDSLLASEGVEAFDSLGEEFDPRFHEALTRRETTDHPPGTVIAVLRAGYKMRGEVLRPAMVEVATAPTADQQADRHGRQQAE